MKVRQKFLKEIRNRYKIRADAGLADPGMYCPDGTSRIIYSFPRSLSDSVPLIGLCERLSGGCGKSVELALRFRLRRLK